MRGYDDVIAYCVIPVHPASTLEVVLEEAMSQKLADSSCEAFGSQCMIDEVGVSSYLLNVKIGWTDNRGRVFDVDIPAYKVKQKNSLKDREPPSTWCIVVLLSFTCCNGPSLYDQTP